jgi:hypothetical protein
VNYNIRKLFLFTIFLLNKKALTTFLTYGIYSLRVASDLPVQSQYFPIISYYFLFSILYTLIIMIWFIIANQFLISKEIPYFFEKLANLLSYLKCCKWQASKVVFDAKKEEEEEVDNNPDDSSATRCFKCQECSFCLIKKKNDTIEKNNKSKHEFKIKILNDFFFLFMLFLFISTNLIIWILITTN